MPQMAPLSWIILFIMFSTLLFFSLSKIFFCKLNQSKINNSESLKISMNEFYWKW